VLPRHRATARALTAGEHFICVTAQAFRARLELRLLEKELRWAPTEAPTGLLQTRLPRAPLAIRRSSQIVAFCREYGISDEISGNRAANRRRCPRKTYGEAQIGEPRRHAQRE